MIIDIKQKEQSEIELEANKKILEDMKELINKNVSDYKGTNAFMVINRCLDELVNVEQYARLKAI